MDFKVRLFFVLENKLEVAASRDCAPNRVQRNFEVGFLREHNVLNIFWRITVQRQPSEFVGKLSLAADKARNLVVAQVFVELDSVALAGLDLIELPCLLSYLYVKSFDSQDCCFLQTRL
jgi:hypothetical protein